VSRRPPAPRRSGRRDERLSLRLSADSDSGAQGALSSKGDIPSTGFEYFAERTGRQVPRACDNQPPPPLHRRAAKSVELEREITRSVHCHTAAGQKDRGHLPRYRRRCSHLRSSLRPVSSFKRRPTAIVRERPRHEALNPGGKRVLVVEDEYLVAPAVEDVLSDAGCTVVGPLGRVQGALAAARSKSWTGQCWM
jgi:hypothetical protein